MKTPNPDYAGRVQASFARQAFVNTIGASLAHVGVGEVDIALPRNDALAQQYGYVHGGVLISIADAAAGYAALTVTALGAGVLTAELKVNFLRPAQGDMQVARGRIIKPGKTLTICQSDVFDRRDGDEIHVLTALVTMMHVDGLDD